ncbi:uncharacterized protein LOC144680941 isoform X2 [Cetorhinus maximus]
MPLTQDDLVTFQTFCSAVSWLSKASVETKLRGCIDEDQFVTWIWRLPQDVVESILHFPIIPQDIIAASKDQPSSSANVAAPQETSGVTDEQLLRIASEMSDRKRDWKLLANNLGFLEKESHAFEGKHSEINQQILEMLQTWQRKAGLLTEASVLQSVLQASGNTDISNEVFQLSF